MNWSFISPGRLWWLIAVAAMAAAYVAMQFRRTKYAVRFSNMDLLDKVAPKRPGWRRHVVAAVYLLALAAMVFGVARPQAEERVPKERATIILAIDTSLSMQATDVSPTRIDAAKVAAVKFVESMPPKVRLGVVDFSGSTKLLVPPTTQRDTAVRAIKNLELGQGTAIGAAIDTSLTAIANSVPSEGDTKIPAVIVLISDGKDQGQSLPVPTAIERANQAGVPVFTIAYGTPDGVVQIDDPTTGATQLVPVPVDEPALAEVAKETGGESFAAASAGELEQVYDKLGSAVGYDVEQQEVTWKLIAGALVALALSGALSLVWFQRLP